MCWLLSHVWLFATPWPIPVRFLCPWNSPGKNTGVGCHALLQGIFLVQGLNTSLLHCRQVLYHLSHQTCLGYHKIVHLHFKIAFLSLLISVLPSVLSHEFYGTSLTTLCNFWIILSWLSMKINPGAILKLTSAAFEAESGLCNLTSN